MKAMLLKDEWITEITAIVKKHVHDDSARLFVFGSYATGNQKHYSDVDIGIDAGTPLEIMIIARIKDELEESNLPVTVDVVDFARAKASFKKVALQKIIPLQ